MNETPKPAPSGPGGGEPGPARLLDEMRVIRDRTSVLARAYWLPLLLFGLVICGSLPFYQRLVLGHASPPPSRLPSTCVPGEPCRIAAGGHYRIVVSALGWYWQVAVPVAVALSVLWYRWRADRTGLRTPARAFLVTGLVLGELVLLISLLVATQTPGVRNDIVSDSHHVGGLLVIAAVLWVLAWAERSKALAAITAIFIVIALPLAVVTGGGIGGGSTGAADISLATMRLLGLIPALVLLAAGAGAWVSQRSRLRA
jgi:hypothetical protein